MTFNLAEMICRKHQDAILRIALEEVRIAGSNTYTFGGLDYLSDKFATVLRNCRIKQGEVVAVVLPPSAAFVVAHFAALKLGAIVAPLSIEVKPSLLKQFVIESQAKAIILDEAVFDTSENLYQGLNEVELFIASDYVSKVNFGGRGKGFWYEINFADADFKITATVETTPAYIFFEQDESNIFISTIYPHGLIVESFRDKAKREEFDCNGETPVHTPNDWSSKTVLFDLLYPAWFTGCTISADGGAK